MCHIVVIIIDIVCNIWQQILYHIVVLIFKGEYKCLERFVQPVNDFIFFFYETSKTIL